MFVGRRILLLSSPEKNGYVVHYMNEDGGVGIVCVLREVDPSGSFGYLVHEDFRFPKLFKPDDVNTKYDVLGK